MTYFPQEIMTTILEYCDDRVERRQRLLKGKVLDVIHRNKDNLSVSGIMEDLTDEDYDEPITEEQLFVDYYENFMMDDPDHLEIHTMNIIESKSILVSKKYNINRFGKTHLDIIREAGVLFNHSPYSRDYELAYTRLLYSKK